MSLRIAPFDKTLLTYLHLYMQRRKLMQTTVAGEAVAVAAAGEAVEVDGEV